MQHYLLMHQILTADTEDCNCFKSLYRQNYIILSSFSFCVFKSYKNFCSFCGNSISLNYRNLLMSNYQIRRGYIWFPLEPSLSHCGQLSGMLTAECMQTVHSPPFFLKIVEIKRFASWTAILDARSVKSTLQGVVSVSPPT